MLKTRDRTRRCRNEEVRKQTNAVDLLRVNVTGSELFFRSRQPYEISVTRGPKFGVFLSPLGSHIRKALRTG